MCFLTLLLCLPLTLPFAASYDDDNLDTRKKFTNENAPIEVHFWIFLAHFDREEPHSNSSKYFLREIGISDSDLDDVGSYLRSLNSDIDQEVSSAIRRVACPVDENAPQGAELYPIYNEFDEIRQAVHAKYLAIAAAEMSRRGYDHFRVMLMKAPGSFGMMVTEHRHARGSYTQIDINHQNLCNQLNIEEFR